MDTPLRSKVAVSFFFTAIRTGGGEKVLLNIADALSREGVAVEIVLANKKWSKDAIPKHLKVINLRAPRLSFAIVMLAFYLLWKRPKSLIATQEHGLVVAFLARAIAFSGTRIVARVGIPLSILFTQYKKARDRFMPGAMRKLYPKADAFIAVSEGVADDLSKTLSIPRSRIAVINNPARVGGGEGEIEIPHEWFGDPTTPVILGAGRLDQQKDFETLIKAFAEASKKRPARLMILGEGERYPLERLAWELGVREQVYFPGFVPNPKAYMKNAGMFVLSSKWEGFPNVVIDALSSGTPVIATDCPYGPREILAPGTGKGGTPIPDIEEAQYGVLVSVGNITQLSKALEKILSFRALREQYLEKGKKRAQDFAMEKILPHYKKLLNL